jgi:SAM-dependent methyltransferase
MSDLGTHDWGDAPDLYGPRHAYRESLIMRRVRAGNPGPRTLNAGAGAGSLTMRLVADGFDVTSIDASAAFCASLEQRLAAVPAGKHRVMVGDLEHLELPDAGFDLVTCGEVLEHLDDDAAGAAELARVTDAGGLLVVTVPAGPYRFDWTDHWAGHRRRYTPAGLRDVLTGAGFVDVDVVAWGFPLSGLYHRAVYRRALRRRLDQGREGLGGAPPRWIARPLRAAFELDTLFLGRRPGFMGLLATARKPR